ncbi:MAG: hypothetical protein O7G32_08745, partial [SAR324 cluster bacterium]|nr:hypothetical protein [SAR324 cluster bacterium]
TTDIKEHIGIKLAHAGRYGLKQAIKPMIILLIPAAFGCRRHSRAGALAGTSRQNYSRQKHKDNCYPG